jgi:hypothetical protein
MIALKRMLIVIVSSGRMYFMAGIVGTARLNNKRFTQLCKKLLRKSNNTSNHELFVS